MKTFTLNNTNNKGRVILIEQDNETVSQLLSYDTIVAEYNHNTNVMNVFGYYSLTTMKHINSFLEFYGFNRLTKQELIKKYDL